MYQVRTKALHICFCGTVTVSIHSTGFSLQSSYSANIRFILIRIYLKFHEISLTQSRYSDDISRKEDEKNSLFEKLNGFNSTLSQ